MFSLLAKGDSKSYQPELSFWSSQEPSAHLRSVRARHCRKSEDSVLLLQWERACPERAWVKEKAASSAADRITSWRDN